MILIKVSFTNVAGSIVELFREFCNLIEFGSKDVMMHQVLNAIYLTQACGMASTVQQHK